MFSGGYSQLPLLLQTDFHPERFASFIHPLYQCFKVNFLTLHPSPGFHREMIHSIQVPIYKCKQTGNQQGYGEGFDKSFFMSYICGQKTDPKHGYYGFQKDCTSCRKEVEQKTKGRKSCEHATHRCTARGNATESRQPQIRPRQFPRRTTLRDGNMKKTPATFGHANEKP